MKKKKIVIVGAGPGGLTSAMLLSKKGFDVTVVEKSDRVGGRNAMLDVGGVKFDTGPTFLMMKFVLDEMFRLTGKKAEDYLEFVDLDPMYRLNFIDRTVNIYSDQKKMEKEIAKNFPGEEERYGMFLKNERERYEKLFNCLSKDYSKFVRFFQKDFIRAIPIFAIGRSLFDVLGDYFKSKKLRLCFTFQSKYLGMSPWDCPGAFAMIPFVEHHFGIFHVVGGLNKISEVMEKVSKEHGAKILLKSKVSGLVIEDGVAKGVKLENGKEILADEVIINADFANAMASLFPKGYLKKYSPGKLKKKKYSCSTFMLYITLKREYDLAHHNIYFAERYRHNVENIFKHKVLSDDMSFYIQNPSVSDPKFAPKGKSGLYVLVPAPNNSSGIDWEKEKDSYKEKVLKKIIERTGFSDLRENIVEMKIITPKDWEGDYNVFFGATFNLAHSLDQMLYFRPHNKFEELENCYLVGGGTHPGSGLPTIYESARISSAMICEKYGKKLK